MAISPTARARVIGGAAAFALGIGGVLGFAVPAAQAAAGPNCSDMLAGMTAGTGSYSPACVAGSTADIIAGIDAAYANAVAQGVIYSATSRVPTPGLLQGDPRSTIEIVVVRDFVIDQTIHVIPGITVTLHSSTDPLDCPATGCVLTRDGSMTSNVANPGFTAATAASTQAQKDNPFAAATTWGLKAATGLKTALFINQGYLALTHIVLDGGATTDATGTPTGGIKALSPLIWDTYQLAIGDGAVLRNNDNINGTLNSATNPENGTPSIGVRSQPGGAVASTCGLTDHLAGRCLVSILPGSEIMNNSAVGGGAVLLFSGKLDMQGGEVHHNHAAIGGAFRTTIVTAAFNYPVPDTIVIDGGSIHHNAADVPAYSGSCVEPVTNATSRVGGSTPYINGCGGAIAVGMATLTINGGQIHDNVALTTGGAVWLGATFLESFTLTGGVIADNRAQVGGAIFSGWPITMTGGSIVGNAAVDGNPAIVNGTSLTGNPLGIPPETYNSEARGRGGGIFFATPKWAYDPNSTTYYRQSPVAPVTTTISGGSISGNTADIDGGGMYVQANPLDSGNRGVWVSDGTVDITGTAVIGGNTAGNDGGGIYVNTGAKLNLSGDATFLGNTANAAAARDQVTNGSGGAIWIGTTRANSTPCTATTTWPNTYCSSHENLTVADTVVFGNNGAKKWRLLSPLDYTAYWAQVAAGMTAWTPPFDTATTSWNVYYDPVTGNRLAEPATGTMNFGYDNYDINYYAVGSLELSKRAVLDNTQTGDPDTTDPGDVVQYSFVVTNTGETVLRNVGVTDSPGDFGVDFSGTGPAPTVTCPKTRLLIGEAMTCVASHYTLTADDIDAGVVTDTAQAHGTTPEDEVVYATASAEVTYDQAPALELVKTADPASVSAEGQTIAYEYVVRNAGLVPVDNPVIAETGFSGTGTMPATIACPDATLAPGASTTCTATYTVTQADIDAGGTISNTALASAEDPEGNPVVSLQDTADVTVVQHPHLTMIKTVDPAQVKAGDKATYTFEITNDGNVTLTGVGIREGTFTGAGTLSGVTCSPTRLAPDDKAECTATYTAVTADAGTTVSNTATATGKMPDGTDAPPSEPSPADFAVIAPPTAVPASDRVAANTATTLDNVPTPDGDGVTITGATSTPAAGNPADVALTYNSTTGKMEFPGSATPGVYTYLTTYTDSEGQTAAPVLNSVTVYGPPTAIPQTGSAGLGKTITLDNNPRPGFGVTAVDPSTGVSEPDPGAPNPDLTATLTYDPTSGRMLFSGTTTPGVYTFLTTYTDTEGQTVTVTNVITVTANPPTAVDDATTIRTGGTAELDNQVVTDVGVSVLWGDTVIEPAPTGDPLPTGCALPAVNGTGKVTFTCTVPGTYVFTTTYTDSEGHQVTVTNTVVVIKPDPPTATPDSGQILSLSRGGNPATLGLGNAPTPAVGALIDWAKTVIVPGPGNPDPSAALTLDPVTHAPVFSGSDTPGVYVFQTTYTDTYGSSVTVLNTITVLGPPTAIDAHGSTGPGQTILLDNDPQPGFGVAIVDPATAVSTADPSAPNPDPAATLTYDPTSGRMLFSGSTTPGTYTFRTTYTDPEGQTVTVTNVIVVTDVALTAVDDADTISTGEVAHLNNQVKLGPGAILDYLTGTTFTPGTGNPSPDLPVIDATGAITFTSTVPGTYVFATTYVDSRGHRITVTNTVTVKDAGKTVLTGGTSVAPGLPLGAAVLLVLLGCAPAALWARRTR